MYGAPPRIIAFEEMCSRGVRRVLVPLPEGKRDLTPGASILALFFLSFENDKLGHEKLVDKGEQNIDRSNYRWSQFMQAAPIYRGIEKMWQFVPSHVVLADTDPHWIHQLSAQLSSVRSEQCKPARDHPPPGPDSAEYAQNRT